MFTVEALSERIRAYQSSHDLQAFEDWFRSESWGWYDRSGEPLSDAIAAVEFSLAAFDDGEIDEDSLRKELAVAIRPFVPPVPLQCGSSDTFSSGRIQTPRWPRPAPALVLATASVALPLFVMQAMPRSTVQAVPVSLPVRMVL